MSETKTIDVTVRDEKVAKVLEAAVIVTNTFDGQYVPNPACKAALELLRLSLVDLDEKPQS